MPDCSGTLRLDSLLPCDEKFFALRNSNRSLPANSASSTFDWENSLPPQRFLPAAHSACRHHALHSSAAMARPFFIRAVQFRISVRRPLRRSRSASHPSLPRARESPLPAIFAPQTSRLAARARRSFLTRTIFCITTRNLAASHSTSEASPTSLSFLAPPSLNKFSPSIPALRTCSSTLSSR